MGARDVIGEASRSAEGNSAFRMLARGGYAATGIVHGIVGVLMLVIAFTGSGESDQSSALSGIGDAPLGMVAVGALAGLLLALGLFHLAMSFSSVDREDRDWGRRISHWGQSAAFIALGVVAVYAVVGGRSDGDENAEEVSRGLLDLPAGPVLLILGGAGIAIGGIVFAVMGLRRSFEKQMRLPNGPLGKAITVLGLVGYIAKGLSIALIGGLLALAGVRDDPGSAGALDSAVHALQELPGGPVIVMLMGCGFIAYGLFCGARARYAEL